MSPSPPDHRRARLTAQLLAGAPARSPTRVAERLLAVQAQDPRGARLAIRARTENLTAADVDRALSDERSLVISWLNRGTLHLVRSEDYAWLQALLTPPLLSANARRLAQEGITAAAAERGVATIERALAADGALTREELRQRIAAAGVRTEGQALVHLLLLASLRGLVLRGPMRGKDHAFVLVRDWLGDTKPVDRDNALAELARRYLGGHGPASDRDLARWSGLPLRDARAGLAAIAPTLVEVEADLFDLVRSGPPAPLPPPRLLGPFDPLLLGWCSRADILAGHQHLVSRNGIFRPVALRDGRAVGTWRLRRGAVELAPFVTLEPDVRAAFEAEAIDIQRFLAEGGGPSADPG
jgi:uncharacterized protein YcaQ